MKFQDDSYYIEKVLVGDVSAYKFLVQKHKSLVFSIALKVLGNREDAEEIAQDTFVKAYQSLSSFEKKSKFSTWLYRIAYNAAISRTRKKKPEFVGMDDYVLTNYTTDEISKGIEKYEETDRIRLVENALKRLPEEDNLLVTLFYKAEHSIEDISSITGLSESNVKVRLHRIRKRLYDDLQEQMKMI
jgi:RNA polymerase sigma-70 factor (ECF subfamily)